MRLLRRARLPLLLAAVALAGAAIAHAAIPNSSSKVISTCYSTSNGALRVIDRQAGAGCTSTEKLLEFNQKGMRWRSAYVSTTAYAINDAVSYNGSAYIAIATPPVGTVPTNATYWSLLAAKGSTGAPGAQGLRWRSAYVGTTAYAINDAVSHSGSSYIAIATPPAGTVPTNTTYWSLLAAKGST